MTREKTQHVLLLRSTNLDLEVEVCHLVRHDQGLSVVVVLPTWPLSVPHPPPSTANMNKTMKLLHAQRLAIQLFKAHVAQSELAVKNITGLPAYISWHPTHVPESPGNTCIAGHLSSSEYIPTTLFLWTLPTVIKEE